MLSSERLLVSNDDVDHFKVFHNSMEVGKMDTTACEIAAQFILAVENIDGIVNRTTVALN